MPTPRPLSSQNLRGSLPWMVLAALLILMGLYPGESRAQEAQHEQAQQYIDRNHELLVGALEIVGETEAMPPRRILKNAADRHWQSVHLLAENRPVMALQAARRCRDGIRQAVLLARESLGQEERLRQRLDRFHEQQANLLEVSREAQDQRAMVLLTRSRRMFDRARDQYHQGETRLAMQLLDQAEELLTRAARMLAGQKGKRLERALELARMALQQSRDTLQDRDDPATRDLLSESEQALERALDFRDQGRPGRALRMAGLARRLARRALDRPQESSAVENVQRQIQRWDERAAQLEPALSRADDATSALFERAEDHRRRAAEQLAAERTELALRQIRAAHDLMGQLEDRVK